MTQLALIVMKPMPHFTKLSHRNLIAGIARLGLVLAALCGGARAENIVYPRDAGVINVNNAPYHAAGDGQTDDTAALQKAILDHVGENRILYLPNGVYLISDTLRWGDLSHKGHGKRLTIQGQSRDGVTLHLKNNCQGFGDAKNPRAMMITGKAPAQRFANNLRNLTFDVGTGNPGAVALRYMSSNIGSLQQVRFNAPQGSGLVALDLAHTSEIGPFLARHVTIEGFDYGIRTSNNVNGGTFEFLTLKHQRKLGIDNPHQVLAFRRLTSENRVTVYHGGQSGVACFIDSVCKGGDPALPAIVNRSIACFVRNLKVDGYALAIENLEGRQPDAAGPVVEQWVSHAPIGLFNSPMTSLNLPVEETPVIPWEEDFSRWANVRDFGAAGDRVTDDTAAIQAAIDSGASTVYLPPDHAYIINGSLILRKDVSRFMGMRAFVGGEGEIVHGDGRAPAVIVEGLESSGPRLEIRQRSQRTLVVRSCFLASILGESSGTMFIDDVSDHDFRDSHKLPLLDLRHRGQRVFCRQLNPENKRNVKLVNNGADLWILGLKSENAQTVLKTRGGGTTEVLGGHVYAQGSVKESPCFVVENGRATFAAVRQYDFHHPRRWYVDYVREQRGDIVLNLDVLQTPGTSTLGYALPLYVAVDDGRPQPPAPAHPRGLTARSIVPTEVELSWSEVTGRAVSLTVERAIGDGDFQPLVIVGARQTSYRDTDVWDGVHYRYRLSAVGPGGYSAPSAEAGIRTPSAYRNRLEIPAEDLDFRGEFAGHLSKTVAVLKAEKTGDAMEADVFFHRPGEFVMSIAYKSHRDRGRARVYFDEKPVGGVVDQHEDSRFGRARVEALGAIKVESAGRHTVRIESVGKAPKSSSRDITVSAFVFAGGSSPQPSPPPIPQGLSAEVAEDKVTLKWDSDESPKLGYHIDRRPAKGGISERIAELDASTHTFVDEGVWADVEYEYTVRSYNLDGDSPASAAATVRTPAVANGASRIEVENLAYKTNKRVNEFAGSSGQAHKLASSNEGDYVEYVVPIHRPGIFKLSVAYKPYKDRGIAQLSINGQDVAPPVDQYADTPGRFLSVKLTETVRFTAAGNYRFRMSVRGKNPDAGTPEVTMDYFELAATTDEPIHVMEPIPVTGSPTGETEGLPKAQSVPLPGASPRGRKLVDADFDSVPDDMTTEGAIRPIEGALAFSGSSTKQEVTHTATMTLPAIATGADFTMTVRISVNAMSFSGGSGKTCVMGLRALGAYDAVLDHQQGTLVIRKADKEIASARFERLETEATYQLEFRGRGSRDGVLSLIAIVAGNGAGPVAATYDDSNPANGERFGVIAGEKRFKGAIEFDDLVITNDATRSTE